jgi:transposase-like protein
MAPKLGVGPETLRRWVLQARWMPVRSLSSKELYGIKRVSAEVLTLKESNGEP